MPKTIQQSRTNPPQPRQNRCQNLPKSSPRRSKIDVWRGFRWKSLSDLKLSPLFSAPGGRLGASWERLGRVSGPSWGHLGNLGVPWKRLGGVLERLCRLGSWILFRFFGFRFLGLRKIHPNQIDEKTNIYKSTKTDFVDLKIWRSGTSQVSM